MRSLERLSLLSRQLSHCLDAGMPPSRALRTVSARATPHGYRRALETAAKHADAGRTLGESLEPLHRWLPDFVFPFIAAAEQSGQSAEAFTVLAEIANRLRPVWRTVRQIWQIPVGLLAFGELIQIGILLWFGKTAEALAWLGQIGVAFAIILTAYHGLRRLPTSRKWVDQLLARTPYWGQLVTAISLTLFFQGLSFLYRAGQRDIHSILASALSVVPNLYLREDIARIDQSLAAGNTLPEAFHQPRSWPRSVGDTLSTGALVGRLEESLNQVTQQTMAQLETQLAFTQVVLSRLLLFLVYASIAGTILRVISV